MNLNFFKQLRILDGGMGQELLARGMEPNGTLWSANALLNENYHKLLLDIHLDFVKAGAEVIVTACSLSHSNLDSYQGKAGRVANKDTNIPAVNLTEIIAFALGYFPDRFAQLKTRAMLIGS